MGDRGHRILRAIAIGTLCGASIRGDILFVIIENKLRQTQK